MIRGAGPESEHPIRVNHTRFLTTLLDLCSIPSPSGSEDRVASRVLEFALANGITVVEDGSAGLQSEPSGSDSGQQGNIVLACESSSSERLFLSAHLDTVDVPHGIETISVLNTNGRIVSEGDMILGGDDKVGVAAALEMLSLCVEHPNAHRSLEVVLFVQEELGCRGSRLFDPGTVKAKTGFNLDGETPPFTAIRRAPQKSHFTCTVGGRRAHAALNPEAGINAIVVASHLLSLLPAGRLPGESTTNVGSIQGGERTNVVPDRVVIRGELRSFSGHQFEEYANEIENCCSETAAKFGVPIGLVWSPAYEGYEITTDEECSQWFSSACRCLGEEPQFLSSPGGGDSNNLNAMGLRNVVFGLGMHNIHGSDEYLDEAEILRAVDLLCAAVFPGSR